MPASLNADATPDVYAAISRWLDIGPSKPYRIELNHTHTQDKSALSAQPRVPKERRHRGLCDWRGRLIAGA